MLLVFGGGAFRRQLGFDEDMGVRLYKKYNGIVDFIRRRRRRRET
jgi:hypothetical protein